MRQAKEYDGGDDNVLEEEDDLEEENPNDFFIPDENDLEVNIVPVEDTNTGEKNDANEDTNPDGNIDSDENNNTSLDNDLGGNTNPEENTNLDENYYPDENYDPNEVHYTAYRVTPTISSELVRLYSERGTRKQNLMIYATLLSGSLGYPLFLEMTGSQPYKISSLVRKCFSVIPRECYVRVRNEKDIKLDSISRKIIVAIDKPLSPNFMAELNDRYLEGQIGFLGIIQDKDPLKGNSGHLIMDFDLDDDLSVEEFLQRMPIQYNFHWTERLRWIQMNLMRLISRGPFSTPIPVGDVVFANRKGYPLIISNDVPEKEIILPRVFKVFEALDESFITSIGDLTIPRRSFFDRRIGLKRISGILKRTMPREMPLSKDDIKIGNLLRWFVTGIEPKAREFHDTTRTFLITSTIDNGAKVGDLLDNIDKVGFDKGVSTLNSIIKKLKDLGLIESLKNSKYRTTIMFDKILDHYLDAFPTVTLWDDIDDEKKKKNAPSSYEEILNIARKLAEKEPYPHEEKWYALPITPHQLKATAEHSLKVKHNSPQPEQPHTKEQLEELISALYPAKPPTKQQLDSLISNITFKYLTAKPPTQPPLSPPDPTEPEVDIN